VRTSHGERGQSKYQASPATLGIETTWAAALRKETAHDADAPLAKAASYSRNSIGERTVRNDRYLEVNPSAKRGEPELLSALSGETEFVRWICTRKTRCPQLEPGYR